MLVDTLETLLLRVSNHSHDTLPTVDIAPLESAESELRRFPLQRWWTLFSPGLLVLSVALQWNWLKQLLEPLRGFLGGKPEEAGKERP